jgi:nucleotide-binding universal stress UspA family protein
MYKSIVVGTDGSPTADVALERAIELARLCGAALHVVSAYEPAPARVGGNPAPAEAAEWSISPHFKVDAVLDRAADIAKGGGVDIQPHGPRGDAASAILAVAQGEQADLIVLGSRGMRGARRVLGSVPNTVSHKSPCDVLVVQTTYG